MTSNQIANRQQREQSRHNLETERQGRSDLSRKKAELRETKRSNKVNEAERKRSNMANEANTVRGQNMSSIDRNISSAGQLLGKVGSSLIGAALNDPSWYSKDPALVRDAAQISFNPALGTRLVPRDYYYSCTDPAQGLTVTAITPDVPGIARIGFAPVLPANLGLASPTDTINVAARNIYAYVRYANSGSRNYEAADLMEYLYLMDSAYMLVSHIARCYSVALTYKGMNRYYPQAMAAALCFNLDDAQKNLANYRLQLNVLIQSLNSFYVPASLPLYDRHTWMCGTIFKDSEIHRSQEYVFVPDIYYTFDEDGSLIPQYAPHFTFDSDGVTLSSINNIPNLQAWINALQSIISSLLSDEDLGVMSGDILKAYGESNLMFTRSIPEDFHIESVFSMEVLSQINNATMCGDVSFFAGNGKGTSDPVLMSFQISQDNNGNLLQGTFSTVPGTPENGPFTRILIPTFMDGETVPPYLAPDTFVNFYKDDPSPDDVMVATRLMAAVGMDGGSYLSSTDVVAPFSWDGVSYNQAKSGSINICGTEICTNLILFSLVNAVGFQGGSVTEVSDIGVALYQDQMGWVNPTLKHTGDENTGTVTLNTPFYKFIVHDAFDWSPSPRACVYNEPYSPGGIDTLYVLHSGRDFANAVYVAPFTIGNMHLAAATSLFGIPDLGIKVRSR